MHRVALLAVLVAVVAAAAARPVRAAADLGARHVVPIHWGTFVLSGEPVTEPHERVRAEWVRAGRDLEDLWDLPIGGTRAL